MTEKKKPGPEAIVREIKRNTRRKFSAEEKIRIVLEGLRGEESITTICRREGINPNLYYRWSKSFLEAGKKRLSGDEALPENVASLIPIFRHTSWTLTPVSAWRSAKIICDSVNLLRFID
jgi:transposase